MFRTAILVIFFPMMVVGCAVLERHSIKEDKSLQDRLGRAFTSPLGDFNLVSVTIPPVVAEAAKNPYQLPPDTSCAALAEHVHQLDEALGVDLDVAADEHEKTAAEKGGEFIEDQAIGSIEGAINGLIPFRSWIRKISGADKRSKEIAAAISAGTIRRAFLKGIGREHGCVFPTTPSQQALPATPTTETAGTPKLGA